MRFHLLSDIHIDHGGWNWDRVKNLDPSLPFVVAGDIENDVRAGSRWIAEASQRFEHVIWVAGNHCMYNLGFSQTRLVDREFEKLWPYPRTTPEIYTHYSRWSAHHGVHFLHRGSVDVNGVRFVGATGWHDFLAGDPYPQSLQTTAYLHHMNDARYIQWGTEYKVQEILEYAAADAAYVRTAVAESPLPVVVITHHAPHRELLRKNSNPLWTQLNGSYANTQMETITDPKIQAWCFGHTHDRQDRIINGVRYINNARGYPGENAGWTPVEIEI
jgi:predicted phosphodiesterase